MSRPKTFSIIMAAGKGNRMQCPGQSKVCLDIGGVPAIVRALDAYEACGLGHHIIVVGELADQWAEDLSRGRCPVPESRHATVGVGQVLVRPCLKQSPGSTF
jgi:CTP:molybdopterin cytidylyltransferase MocA